MQNVTIILISLVGLAYMVGTCSRVKTQPARFQHLKGWQKLLGVLAIVMTLLIILNPEFLALGLVGDTAFFDLLVLAISLQLQGHVYRIWHSVRDALSRSLRWRYTPSLGLRCVLAGSVFAITGMVAVIQKVAHRITS